jgi:hypothetical protein
MGTLEQEDSDLTPPPDAAQQPDRSKLAETQALLGNMQLNPDSWEYIDKLDGAKIATILNRIDPAEIFVDLNAFLGGIENSRLDPKKRAELFKQVWQRGEALLGSRSPQQDDPQAQIIFDAVRRIGRFAAGEYYLKSGEDPYAPYEPFKTEMAKRSLTANTPKEYITSLQPAYSIMNTALATQPFARKEGFNRDIWSRDQNQNHLIRFGKALANKTGKPHELCFEYIGQYISNLRNSVNLHEKVEDPKVIVPDQQKSWEKIKSEIGNKNPEWIKNEQIRQRIRSISAKFKEIENIGATNQCWQLVAALPTWQKLDKKGERYEYQLGPSSDDFIETTLSLIEEQINYIQRNGDRMWQSVQEEEAERTRRMWDNQFRPTREKISVFDQEIAILQKDNTLIDGQITDLSQAFESLKKMMTLANQELGSKKAGFWVNNEKLLDEVQIILLDLIKNIESATVTVRSLELPGNGKSKISPVVEPQALLDSNDQYSMAQKRLEQELKDKENQKKELENSRKENEQNLQNILNAIQKIKDIAKECLKDIQQLSDTKAKTINNGLLNLRYKLSNKT